MAEKRSVINTILAALHLSKSRNTPEQDSRVILAERTAIENLPPGMPLSIVLLGKTGHGKSATANSMFGKKIFDSQMSSTSITQKCYMEHGVIGEREIFLVDTPGTMDTKDPDSALLEISHAITLRPDGFHAFLIVLNPMVKMTNEEKMAVILLKKMFGEDIFMRYAILLFTHGDDFFRQMGAAKKKKSFMEYVSSQNGYLGTLVKECNYRCALMNNMETDPGKLRQEVIELIKKVDKMVSENDGRVYTNHLFEFARARIDEEMKKYLDIFTENSSELNGLNDLEISRKKQKTGNETKEIIERKVDDSERKEMSSGLGDTRSASIDVLDII